jgi:hypothetical protein
LGYLQHIHTATERYSIQITDQQKEIWQEQHHRNGIHNRTNQVLIHFGILFHYRGTC